MSAGAITSRVANHRVVRAGSTNLMTSNFVKTAAGYHKPQPEPLSLSARRAAPARSPQGHPHSLNANKTHFHNLPPQKRPVYIASKSNTHICDTPAQVADMLAKAPDGEQKYASIIARLDRIAAAQRRLPEKPARATRLKPPSGATIVRTDPKVAPYRSEWTAWSRQVERRMADPKLTKEIRKEYARLLKDLHKQIHDAEGHAHSPLFIDVDEALHGGGAAGSTDTHNPSQIGAIGSSLPVDVLMIGGSYFALDYAVEAGKGYRATTRELKESIAEKTTQSHQILKAIQADPGNIDKQADFLAARQSRSNDRFSLRQHRRLLPSILGAGGAGIAMGAKSIWDMIGQAAKWAPHGSGKGVTALIGHGAPYITPLGPFVSGIFSASDTVKDLAQGLRARKYSAPLDKQHDAIIRQSGDHDEEGYAAYARKEKEQRHRNGVFHGLYDTSGALLTTGLFTFAGIAADGAAHGGVSASTFVLKDLLPLILPETLTYMFGGHHASEERVERERIDHPEVDRFRHHNKLAAKAHIDVEHARNSGVDAQLAVTDAVGRRRIINETVDERNQIWRNREKEIGAAQHAENQSHGFWHNRHGRIGRGLKARVKTACSWVNEVKNHPINNIRSGFSEANATAAETFADKRHRASTSFKTKWVGDSQNRRTLLDEMSSTLDQQFKNYAHKAAMGAFEDTDRDDNFMHHNRILAEDIAARLNGQETQSDAMLMHRFVQMQSGLPQPFEQHDIDDEMAVEEVVGWMAKRAEQFKNIKQVAFGAMLDDGGIQRRSVRKEAEKVRKEQGKAFLAPSIEDDGEDHPLLQDFHGHAFGGETFMEKEKIE